MIVRLQPSDPQLRIPERGRLLHVGLPKTGTTSLQRVASLRRADLLEQGVHYPGDSLNHRRAGLAFSGRVVGWQKRGAKPDVAAWRRLLEQVHADQTSRVWLSNEDFGEMPGSEAQRLVEVVGGDVHVVMTLRGTAGLLTSAWSQYLKTGLDLPLDDWLERVLGDEPQPSLTPSFRRRNDLSRLVRHWLDAVGEQRLTLVVLDPGDRDRVPTAFETMLGLRPGTLSAVPLDGADTNRSFTVPEAELVRQVNEGVLTRRDVSWGDYDRLVRRGVVDALLRRAPGRRGAPAAAAALGRRARCRGRGAPRPRDRGDGCAGRRRPERAPFRRAVPGHRRRRHPRRSRRSRRPGRHGAARAGARRPDPAQAAAGAQAPEAAEARAHGQGPRARPGAGPGPARHPAAAAAPRPGLGVVGLGWTSTRRRARESWGGVVVVRLSPDDAALLLPAAARLVHVGLPKTGTTALQRTAAQQRSELLRQGVLLPRRRLQPPPCGLRLSSSGPWPGVTRGAQAPAAGTG